ncbi:hypothetical protein BGZ88_001236 [Linnemannia elongata]|nr:hypothetical protein BGZ88_001236 [Linnemannia elongata]
MVSTRVFTALVAVMAVLNIPIQSVPVKHNISSLKQCNLICNEQDNWCGHANDQLGTVSFDCPDMLDRCHATCQSQFQ